MNRNSMNDFKTKMTLTEQAPAIYCFKSMQ